MTSGIAIRADRLSKRYVIGVEKARYRTLRDAIGTGLRRSFDWRRRPQNTIWALKDVSFELAQGEVLGIIGRNGAGKSTLLKILSRITEPTAGRAEARGRVGSLLEVGTGFHPELTGRENIYLNGAILGMGRAEIARKFDDIVQFSGVETFIDTPVKRYSSGMHVRLAFAVAAHLEPEILLVDEVLAVGDVAFQRKCIGKMGDVVRDGRTVLFVSHNMAAVEQLCTQAMLLSDGQVETMGGVRDVMNQYLVGAGTSDGEGEAVLASNADRSVRVVSAVPVDDTKRRLAAVQCGLPLKLMLELECDFKLSNLIFAIGLENDYGHRAAVLHSAIAGETFTLDPGRHAIVCTVPRFPMATGEYSLSLKIVSNGGAILWAPLLTRLTVEAGDFYRTGKLPDPSWAGVCYLEQTWEARGSE